MIYDQLSFTHKMFKINIVLKSGGRMKRIITVLKLIHIMKP